MIGQKLKRLMRICTYWPDEVQQANPEADHEFRYAKATPYAEIAEALQLLMPHNRNMQLAAVLSFPETEG